VAKALLITGEAYLSLMGQLKGDLARSGMSEARLNEAEYMINRFIDLCTKAGLIVETNQLQITSNN